MDEAFPIVRTRDPVENVQRTIRSENLRFADLAKRPDETTDLPSKLRKAEYLREANRDAIEEECRITFDEIRSRKRREFDYTDYAKPRGAYRVVVSQEPPTRSQRLWAWIKKGFSDY